MLFMPFPDKLTDNPYRMTHRKIVGKHLKARTGSVERLPPFPGILSSSVSLMHTRTLETFTSCSSLHRAVLSTRCSETSHFIPQRRGSTSHISFSDSNSSIVTTWFIETSKQRTS